ncbi:MAG: flagellar protein [Firmicutes bacterium]|nr:flagellar protein [Bacillota bacterium]
MPPVAPGGQPPPAQKRSPARATGEVPSFSRTLREEIDRLQAVRLSAHAEKRLRQNNIALTPGDLAKISDAIQLAAAKGARDSLIVYGDIALIASVANKTVVTALDGRQPDGRSQVVTNIDSAVIIR